MPVELPIFHLGTYRSSSGVPVTFTPALLHQLAKNTKLALKHNFQPPIGYDHPAARDNGAHGRIADVRVENDKMLIATLETTSDQLKQDAANFRRLTYSPEFDDFEFVHEGETVKLGPTVIGLSMLGAQRGAIKNTNMVKLSEVNFGEAVDPADAFILRSELRSLGYVGEYEVNGKFFAEVENDERRFSEQREQTMTDEQIQAAIDAKVTPLKTANDALTKKNDELSDQLRQFTETSARKTAAHEFTEKLKGDKKYLGKIPTEMLEDILADPTIPAPGITKIKAFAAALPAFQIPVGEASKKKSDDGDNHDVVDDGDGDEPPALAKVRVKHFAQADDARAQQIIEEGIVAFSEFKPDAFKGIENDPAAQIGKLRTYVQQRDTAAN